MVQSMDDCQLLPCTTRMQALYLGQRTVHTSQLASQRRPSVKTLGSRSSAPIEVIEAHAWDTVVVVISNYLEV